MRKGAIAGAVIGFIVGLLVQTTGSLVTGMATIKLSAESTYILATSITALFFIAALFGVIGAFLGALMQEVIDKR